MTNSIDSSYYLSNANVKQSTTGNNTLGKDAFLKLLVTQLKNQDPISPMDNSEFISQMATFSQLEQIMSINEEIEELIETNKTQQMFSYQSLLGKEVQWNKETYSDDNQTDPILESGRGTITSIKFSDDGAIFYLADGTKLTADNISGISALMNANAFTDASNLIGKKINWEKDGQIQTSIVKAVSQKDGQIYYLLDDDTETKITNDQIISISVN